MKTGLRLCASMIFLCAALPSFSQTARTTTMYTTPEEKKAYRPFITAYAGMGWYYWNDYSSFFQSANKNALKQEVDPYIMKKFYVKADLWLINCGIEYFTSKFTDFEGITEEQSVEERNDPIAKYLRLFSGISIGSVELKGNMSYKKFQGTLKSNEIEKTNGTGTIPIYYYPESGGYVPLSKGDEITWFSIVKDYELVFSLGANNKRRYGAYGTYDIGVRYTNYSAPQKLRFSNDKYTALTSDITAVMLTEYHIYCLSFGWNFGYTTRSLLYYEFYLPAVLGFYRFENNYMDVKPNYPYNYAVSGRGKLCMGFDFKHVKIEGGIDYTYFYCNTMASTTLKQDIDYLSEVDGTPGTLVQGSKVQVAASRLELFWGLYVHASILL